MLVATPEGPVSVGPALEKALRQTGYVSSINGKQGAVHIDTGGPSLAQLSSTFGKRPGVAYRTVYVSPQGNDANNGDTWGSAVKTLAGALTAIGAGNFGKVRMGVGVIDAGSGVSLSGYRCSLIGEGDATVITATSPQTGPVLDMVGYLPPDNASAKRPFGNFKIVGDNTVDPTKTHKGLRCPGSAAPLVGMHLFNISAEQTGGAPLDLGATELCTLQNLTANTPVGVVTNDVPYIMGTGACNGNNWIGCGMRSIIAGQNVGASGAFVLQDDGSYPPYGNVLDLWVEYLHVPSGGSVIVIAGYNNALNDPQFHDTGKVAGATNTSYVRFKAPAVTDLGANVYRGHVPGDNGGTTVDIDYGLRLSQSRNTILGIKGYLHNNVLLDPGVQYTHAIIGGQLSGTVQSAGAPTFVDNSGQSTNVLIDSSGGQFAVTGTFTAPTPTSSDNSGKVATTAFVATAVAAAQAVIANTTAGLVAAQKLLLSLANYTTASGQIPTDANSDGLADGLGTQAYGAITGDTYTPSIVSGRQRWSSAWASSGASGNRRVSLSATVTSGRQYLTLFQVVNGPANGRLDDALSTVSGSVVVIGAAGSVANTVLDSSGAGLVFYLATAASSGSVYTSIALNRINGSTRTFDIVKAIVVDVTALLVDAPNFSTATPAQLAAFVAGMKP